VCEFYDQPNSIQLHYHTGKGKAISALHTPDYFVIRQASAGWIECKTEEQLLKLAESQPNRSLAGIDWIYQRNVLFLEDFLRAETLEISAEMIAYLRSRAAASPGAPLADLLAETTRHGLTGDCIYTAIVTGQIYINLSAAPLAEPERARVYFDESTARLYQESGRHAASTPKPINQAPANISGASTNSSET
jgi:putative transposase